MRKCLGLYHDAQPIRDTFWVSLDLLPIDRI
jgi:hypothetical protein